MTERNGTLKRTERHMEADHRSGGHCLAHYSSSAFPRELNATAAPKARLKGEDPVTVSVPQSLSRRAMSWLLLGPFLLEQDTGEGWGVQSILISITVIMGH